MDFVHAAVTCPGRPTGWTIHVTISCYTPTPTPLGGQKNVKLSTQWGGHVTAHCPPSGMANVTKHCPPSGMDGESNGENVGENLNHSNEIKVVTLPSTGPSRIRARGCSHPSQAGVLSTPRCPPRCSLRALKCSFDVALFCLFVSCPLDFSMSRCTTPPLGLRNLSPFHPAGWHVNVCRQPGMVDF